MTLSFKVNAYIKVKLLYIVEGIKIAGNPLLSVYEQQNNYKNNNLIMKGKIFYLLR